MARRGKDELDQLQKNREYAKTARTYMQQVFGGKQEASGGALKAMLDFIKEEKMSGGGGDADLNKNSPQYKKSQLLMDVDEGRANLGRLIGSSQGTGVVQKSTSPNIPRTDQGIRNLPKTKIMGESQEEDIRSRPPRNVGKDTPPTRSRNPRGASRPSDDSYFAMRRSEKTMGKIAEIKGIGREVATARTQLSKALVRMIEAEGLDVGTAQKAKAYDLAGPAVSNRDRARLGLGRVGRNLTGGKGRVSQPVQPSVKTKNTAPVGPKMEPITMKGNSGIPKAFIKGLGAGGIGGAFSLSNPFDAASAAALGRVSGGGGGVRSGKLGGKKLKI
jgi:hypothetical protein